jgi:hypothetical protein
MAVKHKLLCGLLQPKIDQRLRVQLVLLDFGAAGHACVLDIL